MKLEASSLLLLSISAATLAAQTLPSSLSATDVIRRSVITNTADWEAQPEYGYKLLNLKSKMDASGHAQSQPSKTFDVMMLEGSPYTRLVALDNDPLGPAQTAQEEARMHREMLRRQQEGPSDRHARIAKYQNDRAEEHLLMQQMVDAFTFRLIGKETVEGAECYVLEAIPRDSYVPPVERAKVLAGMRGRLWIETSQYHWVKVEAEVTRPVSFGFFVAQVKPGTKFELDQAPVGSVWLPKRFTESVNASVFGLYGYRTREEAHFSNYHLNQLSAGSRTLAP